MLKGFFIGLAVLIIFAIVILAAIGAFVIWYAVAKMDAVEQIKKAWSDTHQE